MYARAALAYRDVDLDSADKPDVVTRLFGRFLDDLTRGRTAIMARDIAAKAAALDHAIRIVCELRASLDHPTAPELCANLDALYQFVLDQIYVASSSLDVAPLGHAASVMTQLRDAFVEARSRP
ncbi:MAG TPA: flagellar export chaperone FliS [Kofleriaceae bacterium]|nr:flagellar export chaperone FliS [Kofleriaceae bacterium]